MVIDANSRGTDCVSFVTRLVLLLIDNDPFEPSFRLPLGAARFDPENVAEHWISGECALKNPAFQVETAVGTANVLALG